MKKILILGGTQFIGKYLVEKLIALDSYDITLFNRQQTDPELFPELKKIKGDRKTNNIRQLANQHWDIVIDISCYFPDDLNHLLQTLKGKIGRYIFISTISVYDLENNKDNAADENIPMLTCSKEEEKDTTPATYGKRKVASEQLLQEATWLDKIILRPCVVYGKYDYTERFYYWLYRIQHDKTFLLPNNGEDIFTLTYIDDLATIIIESIEIKQHAGVYNTSTHSPLSFREMLHLIAASLGKKFNATNINGQYLLDNQIMPGKDIPLWFNIPLVISNELLKKDFNITLTTFEESVQQTAAYYETLGWKAPNAGISISKEQELIDGIKST